MNIVSRFTTALFFSVYSVTAHSTPITNLIVFGDSLSDSGNLFLATGQPGLPYFEGKFTNGSIYTEQLNQYLGFLPLMPSLTGGNNYAWAGARAGMDVPLGGGFISGIQSQTDQYLGTLAPNSDLSSTLHLFFIGGNDVSDALDNNLDLPTATGFLQNSAQQVVNAMLAVESISPTQYLLPETPDLSLTPRYLDQQIAQDYTQVYNQLLHNMIETQLPNADVLFFNTSDFITQSTDEFENSTEACLTQSEICADPDNYLFFDDFHPSRIAHQQFGERLLSAIDIPSTWILMLFAGVWILRKKHTNKIK